jgi:hypothetical protein
MVLVCSRVKTLTFGDIPGFDLERLVALGTRVRLPLSPLRIVLDLKDGCNTLGPMRPTGLFQVDNLTYDKSRLHRPKKNYLVLLVYGCTTAESS